METYSVQASNYLNLVSKLDQEIQARLRATELASRELRSAWASVILAKVKRLAQVSLDDISGKQMFSGRLNILKGKSSRLDGTLQRLQLSVDTISSNSGIFENWLKEVIVLDLQALE